MPFFSRVFRSKDPSASSKKSAKPPPPPPPVQRPEPPRPRWSDAWLRPQVAPEEVHELLRGCSRELKARALASPLLLLPFRPASNPSAARTFIRNYFRPSVYGSAPPLCGDDLMHELRLAEPMVSLRVSVVKWCWSRLPGGVVTWDVYDQFKIGEQDSNFNPDAFARFISTYVESDARASIIFDFFDLLAAIAAHSKSNGFGGRKLSRYAGWWAFDQKDTGSGFEAAYRNWAAAADACTHLFFAYLRCISPDNNSQKLSSISALPIALRSLLDATEYPPQTPDLLQIPTTKVVMTVGTVSPTPLALLRRAKNFDYHDSHNHLQQLSHYPDPVDALTDECSRVMKCISNTNQANISSTKTSTSLRDAAWSRFEDVGFGAAIDSESDEDAVDMVKNEFGSTKPTQSQAREAAAKDLNRPTTPSWADFMTTGFAGTGTNGDSKESGTAPNISTIPILLPPDKVLPPIPTSRGQSSQSFKRSLDSGSLDQGELASITSLRLDDSFWWVWITSLAGEEPDSRKAVFGRCALVETVIDGAKWLILEEKIKGAARQPEPGAVVIEKKNRGFLGSLSNRRGKMNRSKSTKLTKTLSAR